MTAAGQARTRTELDGEPVGAAQLQALALTNYGHFTTMRVEDGRVRGLSLHLERLRRDCRTLFGTDLDLLRVRELARRAAPPTGSATVRVTVFDPLTDLGRPAAVGEPRVLTTSRPAADAPLPALGVRSVVYAREVPEVKGVGLFAGLHHRRLAQLDGFDDALYVGRDGTVCEGVTWNIGFFDGSRVVWPAAVCLAGVTMELLKRATGHESRPVRTVEVRDMRAAFATNAAIGVRAVERIDGVRLPAAHPAIDALRRAYLALPGELL
ncbi:aminotransferase class IV family protein [Streptomyces actinomycinicus]|uniref:Aminotransferase class IV family protein n=1 Tax=Streptomyces actinomycinicus TaxID=1695166 RepID=A0A937EQW5_9ACTN|nr:aminotransferase class IV family protein [Streptomyces actinomycinicus]MBL1086551.1 aminotransferase class IV family protein [Streptomyces actinomycinicus]